VQAPQPLVRSTLSLRSPIIQVGSGHSYHLDSSADTSTDLPSVLLDRIVLSSTNLCLPDHWLMGGWAKTAGDWGLCAACAARRAVQGCLAGPNQMPPFRPLRKRSAGLVRRSYRSRSSSVEATVCGPWPLPQRVGACSARKADSLTQSQTRWALPCAPSFECVRVDSERYDPSLHSECGFHCPEHVCARPGQEWRRLSVRPVVPILQRWSVKCPTSALRSRVGIETRSATNGVPRVFRRICWTGGQGCA